MEAVVRLLAALSPQRLTTMMSWVNYESKASGSADAAAVARQFARSTDKRATVACGKVLARIAK
jgi:hypothetical protein